MYLVSGFLFFSNFSIITSSWFTSTYQYTLICIYFQKNIMKCEKKANIPKISEILNIVAQEHRLQIICLLSKHGELCVCDIMEAIDVKQNLASHHLGLLKNIGLLQSRKDGKKTMYSLDTKEYKKFTKNIQGIFNM